LKWIELTRFFTLIWCLLLTIGSVFNQEITSENLILRVGPSVEIDGQLQDDAWTRAIPGEEILVPHPDRDQTVKIKTQVFLGQDGNFLYIAFVCNDPTPEKIMAEVKAKDGELRTDDSVYLFLLGGTDQDYIYFFGLNLLNTKLDGRLSLIDGSKDLAWDTQWFSGVQRSEGGWTAEMAIPLEPFLPPGEKAEINMLVSRVVPRLDPVFWGGPLEPAFSLEQINLLQPITIIKKEKRFRGNSFLLFRQTPTEGSPLGGGLDLGYNFSPLISAEVTLFPEFGLVEPDEERLNFTPYELKIPEKRSFFQSLAGEDQSVFDLFYSKRIRKIQAGAKVKATFPGSEIFFLSTLAPQDDISQVPKASYHFGRISLSPRSWFSLGLTGSARVDREDKWGSLAFDWVLKISSHFNLQGQFAQSYGQKKEDSSALGAFISYQSDPTYFKLGFLRIGRNFGDNLVKVGYIPDDNRQEIKTELVHKFNLGRGVFNSFHVAGKGDVYWGLDNTLRSWSAETKVSLEFKSYWSIGVSYRKEYMLNELYPADYPGLEDKIDLDQWRIYQESLGEISLFDSNYLFNLFNPVVGTHYYLYYGKPEYWTNQTSLFSYFDRGPGGRFQLEVRFGQFLARGFTLFRLYKDLSISQTLFLEYFLYYLDYSFEIFPVYKSANIHVLKIKNKLADLLDLSLFFQANTALDKITLQLRAKYAFWPEHGVAEFVYQRGSSFYREVNENDSAFLSFSYRF